MFTHAKKNSENIELKDAQSAKRDTDIFVQVTFLLLDYYLEFFSMRLILGDYAIRNYTKLFEIM